MSGAIEAATKLRTALIAADAEHGVRECVLSYRAALASVHDSGDDLTKAKHAAVALILAAEALKDAGNAVRVAARAALVSMMAANGDTRFRTDSHTIALVDAQRSVVITDASLVPPALMTTPTPKPDLDAIRARLNESRIVPGAALSNGGEPSLRISTRKVTTP